MPQRWSHYFVFLLLALVGIESASAVDLEALTKQARELYAKTNRTGNWDEMRAAFRALKRKPTEFRAFLDGIPKIYHWTETDSALAEGSENQWPKFLLKMIAESDIPFSDQVAASLSVFQLENSQVNSLSIDSKWLPAVRLLEAHYYASDDMRDFEEKYLVLLERIADSVGSPGNAHRFFYLTRHLLLDSNPSVAGLVRISKQLAKRLPVPMPTDRGPLEDQRQLRWEQYWKKAYSNLAPHDRLLFPGTLAWKLTGLTPQGESPMETRKNLLACKKRVDGLNGKRD